ncbi:hypothetical protein BH10PAT3_BH10PAT3_7980 [soil metagenome]
MAETAHDQFNQPLRHKDAAKSRFIVGWEYGTYTNKLSWYGQHPVTKYHEEFCITEIGLEPRRSEPTGISLRVNPIWPEAAIIGAKITAFSPISNSNLDIRQDSRDRVKYYERTLDAATLLLDPDSVEALKQKAAEYAGGKQISTDTQPVTARADRSHINALLQAHYAEMTGLAEATDEGSDEDYLLAEKTAGFIQSNHDAAFGDIWRVIAAENRGDYEDAARLWLRLGEGIVPLAANNLFAAGNGNAAGWLMYASEQNSSDIEFDKVLFQDRMRQPDFFMSQDF